MVQNFAPPLLKQRWFRVGRVMDINTIPKWGAQVGGWGIALSSQRGDPSHRNHEAQEQPRSGRSASFYEANKHRRSIGRTPMLCYSPLYTTHQWTSAHRLPPSHQWTSAHRLPPSHQWTRRSPPPSLSPVDQPLPLQLPEEVRVGPARAHGQGPHLHLQQGEWGE